MQRLDEKKRKLIVATAARMFATKPYHKVRLDDIAASAHVGKGTVYLYFQNKEDLYFSLIYDGFEQLVDRLRKLTGKEAGHSLRAAEALRRVVDEVVAFAFSHPHFFELMRTVGEIKGLSSPDWARKRGELQGLVAEIIRNGSAAGELIDPNPDMTAACLGGMVRSVMLFGPKNVQEKDVASQVYRLLERGIVAGAHR